MATVLRAVCPRSDIEFNSIAPCPSKAQLEPAALGQRVHGRPIDQLVFTEIFSGTAGLTAKVKRLGLAGSIGVDAHVSKSLRSPVIRLDLTSEHGEALLWRMLGEPSVVAIHLGPPCRTASAPREIKCRGRCPQPLRSFRHPDGVPGIAGRDAACVLQANTLYALTGRVAAFCQQHGLLFCVENPARSRFWSTRSFLAHVGTLDAYYSTCLHHCMVGGRRRKHTRLLHNFQEMCRLQLPCNDLHSHEPWGSRQGKWVTSDKAEYPHLMCQLMAQAFVDCLVRLGAKSRPLSLLATHDDSHNARLAQVGVGKQPRGRRVPPLVSEFKRTLQVTAPTKLAPKRSPLSAEWALPAEFNVVPPHLKTVPHKNFGLSPCCPGCLREWPE